MDEDANLAWAVELRADGMPLDAARRINRSAAKMTSMIRDLLSPQAATSVAAGFVDVRRELLSTGIAQLVTATRTTRG